MGVHTHAATAGLVIHLDPARAGTEIIERVFRIDAALDGVARGDRVIW